MGNEAHLLDPRVAAAAAAIANARASRRGAPAVANILDVLPEALFAEVVEDARAALLAYLTAAADTVPPVARARGPLNVADAAALGLDLGAGTLLILMRDPASRARAVIWAVGVPAAVLDHDEAQQLWSAVAGAVRSFSDAEPTS